MQELVQHKQRTWYDPNLLSIAPEQAFDIEFWQDRDWVVGSAQGRGTTWFVQLGELQGALRHYRRGGLLGKVVSDHYWFTGWKRTRAFQELQLLKQLSEAGVNVPRPIAARAIKGTFCYQADLLSEKIANANDLVTILSQTALSSALYQAIGSTIKKMHQAQVNHTDLNIHNILIDSDQQVWLIDFDKCGQRRGDGWKAANLKRLIRSFYKEKSKRGINWEPSDIEALMAGYQQQE